MAIERFEDIEAWQLGRALTAAVYGVWDVDRKVKDFVLRDQMTRAAGSVMHNIAEGFDSATNAEFVRFLGYSARSCSEVQSALYIAFDRAYLDRREFDELYELCRMTRAKIGAFIQYLNRYPKTRKGGRDPSRTADR